MNNQAKVLVVGSGGREHALAWKLKQSPKVSKIFIAPGNAGTALIGENLLLNSIDEIFHWLNNNKVDLVVIGPDNYLAEGLTDKIKEIGIHVFGPSKVAAQIEWSKSFAKKFMQEEGIPTAKSKIFTDIIKAKEYIKNQNFPLVVKASGLALGKGVVIASNLIEAESALDSIMEKKVFGDAGNEVVIEEYLNGKEFSVHAFCDGKSVKLFPSSQDYKRIFEGNKGPNTGGMGTITPVPWVTDDLLKEIEDKVVVPCIRGLEKRGYPFIGVLYPGIMVTSDGPKVIEFNARFGDPETQSYMRILETDLFDILQACVEGNLQNININWSDNSASCVVCASGGYPGEYKKGEVINGLKSQDKNVVVFHAGTKINGEYVFTNGGRVLGVTAVAKNLKNSLKKSYQAIKSISFNGMQYRNDIGDQEIVSHLNFDKEKATLLLDVNPKRPAVNPLEEVAEKENLSQKTEFHITLIGRETGEEILEIIQNLSQDERDKIFFSIGRFSRDFSWHYGVESEYFLISKEYRLEKSEDKEIRKSIIQIVSLPDIMPFYEKLNGLLGTDFDIPFSHITLFTTSTKESNKFRGIGVYSKEQFRTLNPEKIGVDLDA